MAEIITEEMYKKIKKQNGEAAAKVLRSEILLDIPNLAHILEFAGNDPEKIKALAPVIREFYKTQNAPDYKTNKTPLELLSDAGYNAFVVTTEQQKNSIRNYYRKNEELCTFRDPDRHKQYHMIHAAKHDASQIKPADVPERDDEYGTSVISIQIAKTGGFISIKNRYNHTVNNPDATFNNNPDNIIRGLSNALKLYFNVEFNTTENPLPDNYRMVNDQLVYFNYEIENTYFGLDYYFFGSEITKLNKDYEILLDYFILNIKTGTVKDIAGLGSKDSTYQLLQNMFQNKKITIRTNPNNKLERMIFADGAHVLSVEKGTITELNLPDVKRIDGNFLIYNKNLRKLYAPKLEYVGNEFLSCNKGLTELDLPALKEVGHIFVSRNEQIARFNAPLLKKTGSGFLRDNIGLIELDLPSMKEFGDWALKYNTALSRLSAPKLEKIGPVFLPENLSVTELDFPLVKEIGSGFLRDNKILKRFNAPKLQKVDDRVLSDNLALTELNLPSLEEIGDSFLSKNKKLRTFYAPKLQKVKWGFLNKNTELTDIVIANDKIIHIKHNKRLAMILAKNKIKNKLKNNMNGLINAIARNTKH